MVSKCCSTCSVLLSDPGISWLAGDANVNDSARADLNQHEHKQGAEEQIGDFTEATDLDGFREDEIATPATRACKYCVDC